MEPLMKAAKADDERLFVTARRDFAGIIGLFQEITWGPRKAALWLCGERRSSGMNEPCHRPLRRGEGYGACDAVLWRKKSVSRRQSSK